MAKFWYLDWSNYGRLASTLAKTIKRDGEGFDLVVAIARGGIPLALVVADELGLKMDIINVKSYTGIGKRTQPRILSTLTNVAGGSRILLVDDLVDEGETMKKVTSYLRKMNPEVLKTAVLFKKPWSTFSPDYCLKTVDKWVVFPWDTGETKRLNLKG